MVKTELGLDIALISWYGGFMASGDTPLMAQYDAIKAKHADGILFFRLGDFYEMFGEDAVTVSRLLNLTLTHRGSRQMCGVPCKASKIYIARLLRQGQKVVICEQVGEVPQHGKALTERAVTQIITPGTVTEDEYLNGGAANYIAAIAIVNARMGFAFLDVSTGDFRATSWDTKDGGVPDRLREEMGRSNPRELLLPQVLKKNSDVAAVMDGIKECSLSYYPDWDFDVKKGYNTLVEQFHMQNLKAFGLDAGSAEVAPAGFLLDYLVHTVCSDIANGKGAAGHVREITIYNHNEYLILDDQTRRNLEILQNNYDGTGQYTLAAELNHALTAMGAREVRRRLLFPLIDCEEIKRRQQASSIFLDEIQLSRDVHHILKSMSDIERLSARLSMEKAHPKDLTALRDSILLYIALQDTLAAFFQSEGKDAAQYPIKPPSDAVQQDAMTVADTIRAAIVDEPAASFAEGRIIRDTWSIELGKWRNMHDNFAATLAQYEAKEREQTGIANLKVRSTNNSGLFIEVTAAKVGMVPPHFILRRSTVTGGRYTTAELQKLDSDLAQSAERILELERDLFVKLRHNLAQYVKSLLSVAQYVAEVDAAQCFAQTALEHDWVCPLVDSSLVLSIDEGRHPTVEAHIPSGEFIPNDTNLEGTQKSFALVTGPNMAGKSTYLRQNALIVLLAQIGSFVPAKAAHIGLADRIFCRVGASDNLTRGESTFLVEMTETANILRNATERSLVIMDEVGRGTSTEDGRAIATAVAEHLMNCIKCRTLFATHFRELGRMEHTALIKLCMAVSDEDGEVVFLRRVCEGVAASSYGLHVAAMAGVPKCVVDRARALLGTEMLAADTAKCDAPIAASKAPRRRASTCTARHTAGQSRLEDEAAQDGETDCEGVASSGDGASSEDDSAEAIMDDKAQEAALPCDTDGTQLDLF